MRIRTVKNSRISYIMGNTESSDNRHPANLSIEFNLVPSFKNRSYTTITRENIYKTLGLASSIDFGFMRGSGEDIVIPTIQEPTPPKYVDLRGEMPMVPHARPVLIQGVSISLNGIATVLSALHYQLLKQNLPVFPPSRFFVASGLGYYERPTVLYSLESVFETIRDRGLCAETDYNRGDLEGETISDAITNEKAESFRYIDVYHVENSADTIKLLIDNKQPVIVNLVLYTHPTKIINRLNIPETDERPLGGMSFLLVGYMEERQYYIAMTTLGKEFGASGFVYIPYGYITNMDLCPEKYVVMFNRIRVEGNIQQKKQIREAETDVLAHNREREVAYKSSDGWDKLFS